MTVNVLVAADSEIRLHTRNSKPKLCLKQGNYTFISSKVYALVGAQNGGGYALSCLLSGRADLGKSKIKIDGNLSGLSELRKTSCFIGAGRQGFFKRGGTVRQQITRALNKSANPLSFDAITDKFGLTPERLDRKFAHIGNEHWRASIAIAYAERKRIYCSPYIDETMWDDYLRLYLETWIRMLRDEDNVIFLPVSGISKFRDLTDEVIYFQ